MNRNEWEFPYPADKLLEAAIAKHAFHQGRFDWWKQKRLEVEEKIKAEGIEIDESVAADSGNFYKTSGRDPTVQIRTDLVRDLNECVRKLSEHRAKIDDYDSWTQVLQSQGQASFPLNQDDWLFFFGKK